MKKHNIHSDWKDYISVIRRTAESNGITQNDIAEKTGMQQSAVSRFFSLRSKPQLDTVLNVIKAVGMEMNIQQSPFFEHN